MTDRSAPDRPACLAVFPIAPLFAAAILGAFLAQPGPAIPQGAAPEPKVSKQASDSCARKVERLEAYAAKRARGRTQATRFTEEELNSYLTFELRSKYHASLRSLTVRLEDGGLKGWAIVDFDKLAMTSTRTLTRLLARLLAGVRTLSVQGRLVTADGLGNFELQEAQFDGTSLPNALVQEIITAVGRKQKPPFDPMKPSRMPFAIQRVTLHVGYIDVLQ